MTVISYIQHTLWERPYFMLETQWGRIRYSEWLYRERGRIRANGGDCSIVPKSMQENCKIALFVVPDPRNHQQPSRAKKTA